MNGAYSFNVTKFVHDHKDLIHDVAYDFHGKRIATCSSDQSVKVFDLSPAGNWVCSASWKTHTGSVWKVVWAHPEFGQILATCSFDRTAAIWEEVVSDGSTPNVLQQTNPSTHWVKKCNLVDSRSNVTDVQFAPKHLGLLLATCSAIGVVRVYEAIDVMNLNQWNLQNEISFGKHRCSCLCWNTSKYHPPLIAVGCDDPNAPGAKVALFERSETAKKWSKVETLATISDPVYDLSFAENLGRSFHLLAVASRRVHIFSLKPLQQAATDSEGEAVTKYEMKEVASLDAHNGQVWRVSWNITGTVLASSGADGMVKLWKSNYLGNWKCISTLTPTQNTKPTTKPFLMTDSSENDAVLHPKFV